MPERPTGWLLRRGYFAVEALRRGVTPEMISVAGKILEYDRASILGYVADRLKATHGVRLSSHGSIERAPLTTRTELQERIERLEVKDWRLRWRHTSGTTGEPFHFFREPIMEAWMNAAMWAVYGWHGIGPGSAQVRFWGVPRDIRGRAWMRSRDLLLGRRRFDAFEITTERCAAFFDLIKGKNLGYVYGYPYTTYEFSRRCEETGRDGSDLKIKVVVTTGESLLPRMRETISRFFDCPVVDEYGCTESGILAYECEMGTKHRIPIAAYLECGTDQGHPVASSELGQAILTDLHGSRLPFLRYALGDRIRIDTTEACPCGRDLAWVEVAHGRIASFVRMPSGALVDSAIFMYTVPQGVHYFQARQTGPAEVEVKIVPRKGEDWASLVADCERAWTNALRGAMKVRVAAVDLIPRTASGKFRDFLPLGGPSIVEDE